MRRDHFSSLPGTGSLQDYTIRFNLFYSETSGFKCMVVKCSKISIRLFPIFFKHPFVKGKKGGYKVHSLIKQEGEYKTLLRKHGATADEKRIREFHTALML